MKPGKKLKNILNLLEETVRLICNFIWKETKSATYAGLSNYSRVKFYGYFIILKQNLAEEKLCEENENKELHA